MDRFLDSADAEKRLRSKDIQTRLNASRDRIQRLTQGKVSGESSSTHELYSAHLLARTIRPCP